MITGGDTQVAVMMDVDGVVSPVHGATVFGDDVVAGHQIVTCQVGASARFMPSVEPGVITLRLTATSHISRPRLSTSELKRQGG